MTVVSSLSTFVAETTPPEQLLRIVRDAVADCFGCILAGSDSEVVNRVQDGIAKISQGDVPLFGSNLAFSAGYAAMMNAVSGHCYDLDDWEEPGNTHPTVVMLPAMLAAAHLAPVTGRQMFEAYCVGFEVIARLGEAVSLDHYARGFHSTATLGTIGAAAAASRLLGLDTEKTENAIAIATSQAVGYTVQFGSNTKPLQAGFAARAGLEAALMAKAEVTGNVDTVINQRGFSGLMGDHDEIRFDRLPGKLGSPWALEEFGLILKPWPSCGYTHRLMTAALELRPKLASHLGEVSRIHATQPDFHNAILPFDRPTNRNEALFSAPACIAQTLVEGNLALADCADRFWEKKAVARLIPLSVVEAEPAQNPHLNYDPNQPDVLIVELTGGKRLEARCTYPLGAPQNPMDGAQLSAKFRSITGRDQAQFGAILDWLDSDNAARFFNEVMKS